MTIYVIMIKEYSEGEHETYTLRKAFASLEEAQTRCQAHTDEQDQQKEVLEWEVDEDTETTRYQGGDYRAKIEFGDDSRTYVIVKTEFVNPWRTRGLFGGLLG